MDAKNVVERPFGKWAKRIVYFGASAGVPIFLSQVAQAASLNTTAGAVAQRGISVGTIVAVIVGAIISVLYLRAMYLVLHYASETYDIGFDINTDVNYDRETTAKALIVGSLLLVVVSALIISSYGWGALFLYIGPVLCLLGPIVVIVSMEIDLRKYKRALRHHVLMQRSLSDTPGTPSKDDQILTP